MLQLQTHSAWSESNTACPRPRGGRRGGENWRLVHLRRWKSESRGPSPNLGCVFVQRRRKRRMARPVGPSRRDHFLRVWSKTPNSSPCRLAIGCFQGNQYVTLLSTVLFLATAFQQTVLPPSRALILCTTDRKSLKMTDFSKTGRENMAETCAIIFLTLVSYSTSIAIGGLRRLLLAILMWAGVDFGQKRRGAVFKFFCNFDRSWNKN